MQHEERVLVTGGCGSLGSAIVDEFLTRRDVEQVYVFDHDERGLFNAEQDLKEHSDRITFVLGDVRDQEALEQAFADVDCVVHAAALKHVPVSEQNPYEAIKTNALATQNVIDAARATGVTRVLGVSTDKAAQPTSTMGATKMLAERLLMAADRETDDVVFGGVRLGNVLGSSGSVVRIFEKQIADGGPVTVTHSDMTRFMFTPSEAAEFIVDSLDTLSGGEMLVPKMESVRIMDLADAMIETTAPAEPGSADIDIDLIGMRPGERLHERLLTETEARSAIELEDSFLIPPQSEAGNELVSDGGAELETPYRSDRATHLSRDEVAELLSGL
ncbi:SDR family NAD(P)-dependent oxidoreductase [Salinigranum halophilum]|uniref:SDR family NAD(P)-dependent oxidoreductase n=1 Tax=Salinigranum halophilum TaxID=2565931 RepID=UPI0010A90877|nr:SDR family NAD(P)-dependent oxidoreductase [Salinigranum halophilum]